MQSTILIFTICAPPQGPEGRQGDPGDRGDQGIAYQGKQGPRGEKGEKGSPVASELTAPPTIFETKGPEGKKGEKGMQVKWTLGTSSIPFKEIEIWKSNPRN